MELSDYEIQDFLALADDLDNLHEKIKEPARKRREYYQKYHDYIEALRELGRRFRLYKDKDGNRLTLSALEKLRETNSFAFKDHLRFEHNFAKHFKPNLFDRLRRNKLDHEQLNFIWILLQEDHEQLIQKNTQDIYCLSYLKLLEIKDDWIQQNSYLLDILKRYQKMAGILSKLDLSKDEKDKVNTVVKELGKQEPTLISEKDFFDTLSIRYPINLQRRDILRLIAECTVATFAASIVSGTFYLNELFKRKNLNLLTFLKNYRNRIKGGSFVRRIDIPLLMDKDEIIYSYDFSIAVTKMIRLILRDIPKEESKRVKTLIAPGDEIVRFADSCFKQNHIESILFHKGLLGNAFIGKYNVIITIIGMLNKNIKYTSDFTKAINKDGDLIIGTNRTKKLYYDLDDYWKSPEQTLIEGMGDCEDFSLLAVALCKASVIKETGICLLYNDKDGHAILSLIIDINQMDTLWNYLDSYGSHANYPHIYAPKRNVAKTYKKNCMADSYGDDKYLILLEPQRFNTDAVEIDIKKYHKRVIIMDDRHFNLEDEYTRVFFHYKDFLEIEVSEYSSSKKNLSS